VRDAMIAHVVGSIGPTTSAALRPHGLPVYIEPTHPKSGHLVAALAASWRRMHKAG
jgi:uroporphyrinogen-III synthase